MARGVKPTKQNIFTLSKYRSILNLIIEFQDYKNGLTFSHFRHVLVNGQGIKGMDIYFGDKLGFMVKRGLVELDCITTKENLNHHLNTLLDLEIIEHAWSDDKSDNRVYYRINEDFLNEGIRIQTIELINECNREDILTFDVEDSKFAFYGLSKYHYISFTNDECKEIQSHLKEINKHLNEIQEILNRKYHETFRGNALGIYSDEREKFHRLINKYYVEFSEALFLKITSEIFGRDILGFPELKEAFESRFKVTGDSLKDFVDSWSKESFCKRMGYKPSDKGYDDIAIYYNILEDFARESVLNSIKGITFTRYSAMFRSIPEQIIKDKKLIESQE